MTRAHINDMKKVYSVIVTKFLDDYKARGSSWSESDAYLFSTLDYAAGFVVEEKRRILSEWVGDVCPEDHLERFGVAELKVDEISDKKVAHYFETFNKGEFVPNQYTFDIMRQEVDVTVPASAKKRAKKK